MRILGAKSRLYLDGRRQTTVTGEFGMSKFSFQRVVLVSLCLMIMAIRAVAQSPVEKSWGVLQTGFG